MPAINLNSVSFWQQRAFQHSESYLRAQAAVDRIEDEVFASSGNRQVMSVKLKDHYDPETGRMYKQQCDKRDMHMAVASHAALMAMMLKS